MDQTAISIVLAITSVAALSVSIWSLHKSYTQETERRRHESAIANVQRDSTFEARMADWPDVFRFHGVDLEAAKKEGITAHDIAYLILSLDGLCAYCEARGINIYERLMESDYRQRMFNQQATRNAWKYARLCQPAEYTDPIDRYIKEKYHQEYEPKMPKS
jgi:hypothetical protein